MVLWGWSDMVAPIAVGGGGRRWQDGRALLLVGRSKTEEQH
jgi:hypothetical protein